MLNTPTSLTLKPNRYNLLECVQRNSAFVTYFTISYVTFSTTISNKIKSTSISNQNVSVYAMYRCSKGLLRMH
jgi:hypothetical protein